MKNAFIILLFLFSACATSKKTTKTDVSEVAKTEASAKLKVAQETVSETAEKVKAEVVANLQESRNSETRSYGDSLKGNAFIPAENPAPFSVESGGVKFNLVFQPVLSPEGQFVGHEMQYQAIAKPKTIKNETSNQHANTSATQTTTKAEKVTDHKKSDLKSDAKQSTRKDIQVEDRQTKSQGSLLTWLLSGAGLAVLILLLVVLWLLKKSYF